MAGVVELDLNLDAERHDGHYLKRQQYGGMGGEGAAVDKHRRRRLQRPVDSSDHR